MAFRTAQLQNFNLQGSGVSISDTTMTLTSFQTIDGVDLAMSDFGTIGYMTLEPGSRDREEQISFTGVTQNSNGTATLTGIKTVLFLYPYTETSGFSKSHPGGVIAVVTNTSGFYNKLPAKENNETITGYWAVPDPVSPTDIANRQWVLSVVNGGAVSQNAVIVAGNAGETVSAGNLLYFDDTDNEWKKADADLSATVLLTMMGIAQGSGTNGNPITGGVLIHGVDTNQSGLTIGDPMYASNTAGAISSTPGTISRVIGFAKSTTSIYFDPFFNPGTAPTLQEGIQNGTYVYAADSVGTDAYAVTLSPAVTSLVAGLGLRFKAGTANTGAATLSVNGLTAKDITKNYNEALVTGDILQNQVVTVVYDGTQFQMQSPPATSMRCSSGLSSKLLSDSSTTQTIAHGLGVAPKRVTFTHQGSTGLVGNGTFDASGQRSLFGTLGGVSTSSTLGICIGAGGDFQGGSISVDATNISISWTKNGTGGGAITVNFLWQADA